MNATRQRDHAAIHARRKALAAGVLPAVQPTLPGLAISTGGCTALAEVDDATIGALYERLMTIERASAWIIGDLYWIDRNQNGEAAAHLHLADSQLNSAWSARCIAVAHLVPAERRRPEVTWSHHEAVSKMTPQDQVRWLTRAVDEHLGLDEFRDLLDADRAGDQLPLPEAAPLPRPPATPPREYRVTEPLGDLMAHFVTLVTEVCDWLGLDEHMRRAYVRLEPRNTRDQDDELLMATVFDKTIASVLIRRNGFNFLDITWALYLDDPTVARLRDEVQQKRSEDGQ